MLDCARDQVAAAGHLEGVGHTSDRKIVRLGPAAREHDLRHFGFQKVGHSRSRVVEDPLGALTKVVDARSVAELLLKYTRHQIDNRWVDWSRGVVIEVDAHR